jgi:hypothetical protein
MTIMKNFHDWMRARQEEWRDVAGNVSTSEHGVHNKKMYKHVLPKKIWVQNLWPDLRKGERFELAKYLDTGVQHHTGVHNLLSSWVACANLYFPFRFSDEGKLLLAAFLRDQVDARITSVTNVELEWAGAGVLHPSQLLGESGGQRGSGQTSPDVAFEVTAEVEGELVDGVVLVESKLTEHSFYACSARTKKERDGKPPNPDPARCLDATALASDPGALCHQATWGRRYWEYLRPNPTEFGTLKRCPAASAGYQLLRQQALAEGLVAKGKRFVVSSVAYDERNDTLLNCLKGTGIRNPAQFADVFQGSVNLTLFTHQAWWNHVRRSGGEQWADWAKWIQARYCFA